MKLLNVCSRSGGQVRLKIKMLPKSKKEVITIRSDKGTMIYLPVKSCKIQSNLRETY